MGERDDGRRGKAEEDVRKLRADRRRLEMTKPLDAVPASDVGDLVSEDVGELSLVIEPAQEPHRHVDAAVGKRERVLQRIAEYR